MKIPNKIYLEVLPYSNSKEVFKDVLKTKRTFEDDIEYIRTDAFIEKACEWLEKNIAELTGVDSYAITESFKQAMKE